VAPERPRPATLPRLLRLTAAALLTACLVAPCLPSDASGQSLIAAALPTGHEARRALAPDMRDGRIMHGRSHHRLLHFTFDDGPRIDTTPALLDHLDEADVRATFFLVARQLDGDRGRRARQVSLAREMVRRGHTIGLHGFDHSPLTEMSEHEIEDQIARSEEVFERTFGARPWLFRPPYGRHNEKTDGVLSGHGYTQVLWALNAEGRHIETAEAVRDAFLSSLKRRELTRRPGGFVILHDTHPWVVDGFPLMHAAIEERNCALLALGEELWEVVDDPRLFHVPRGDAEASEPTGVHSLSEGALEARQARIRARARARCGS